MFAVGDAIRWTSSSTYKEGTIVAVVPAGKRPADVGFPKAGGGGSSRREESYVIRGGQPGGSKSFYWPQTSLIRPAEGLTADEIGLCHQHAPAVRAYLATLQS